MGSRPAPSGGPAADRLLRENLARLSGQPPQLSRRIRTAQDPRAEVVMGPRGQATVSWKGQLMASAYDPAAEGQRIAEKIGPEVELVITLGFGTGHHLTSLLERDELRVLAFEPELGLLHAALSANALPSLYSDQLTLTSDADELIEQLADSYGPGMAVDVLTHPGFGRSRPELLRDVVQRIARTKEIIDTNVATLQSQCEPWTDANFENAEWILRLPKIDRLGGVWNGSAVVCAAGPSLSKQLELLAAHAEEVLILAIGQSASALEQAGITPDLIYVVESQNVAHQLEKLSSLADQTLVLATHAHPRLFELPVRRRIVAPDRSDRVGEWLANLDVPSEVVPTDGSVALSAVWLADLLGAREIALIGQDLAFTEGRRYAAGTPYADLEVEEQSDGQIFFTHLKTKGDLFDRYTPDRELAPNTLWVEGWDGEPVLTDLSYAGFREVYRNVGRSLADKGVRLINCTEGGARIPELDQLPFSEWLPRQRGDGASARLDLDRRLHATPSPDRSRVAGNVASLRGELSRLQNTCRRGLEQARKLQRAATRQPGIPAGLLRQVQKSEAELRRRLERIPVVAFVMQVEIQSLLAESRRPGESNDRARIRRSMEMFKAARKAVRRLGPLLGQLAKRVEALDASEDGSEPDALRKPDSR